MASPAVAATAVVRAAVDRPKSKPVPLGYPVGSNTFQSRVLFILKETAPYSKIINVLELDMTKSRINKIILNSSGIFSDDKLEIITEAFTIAVRSTRKLLQVLPNIDVVFYHNPEMVIPETGIGGNTDTQNIIMIPLDADFGLNQHELMLTICHELHHAVRMSQLGDTDSLLKKIVSEGLADQFELEIDPNHHPITYRKDLSSEDIQRGLRDLRQIIQSKDGEYDYYEWFFGYGKYPNWFGYTIGNFIISKYWEKSELTPAELVNQSAEGFIPFLDELIS